eukprot:scaffold15154_cov75-Phaeocystis_antarctica.AAC.2
MLKREGEADRKHYRWPWSNQSTIFRQGPEMKQYSEEDYVSYQALVAVPSEEEGVLSDLCIGISVEPKAGELQVSVTETRYPELTGLERLLRGNSPGVPVPVSLNREAPRRRAPELFAVPARPAPSEAATARPAYDAHRPAVGPARHHPADPRDHRPRSSRAPSPSGGSPTHSHRASGRHRATQQAHAARGWLAPPPASAARDRAQLRGRSHASQGGHLSRLDGNLLRAGRGLRANPNPNPNPNPDPNPDPNPNPDPDPNPNPNPHQVFETQSEPAFCGLGTLVTALNALEVDPGELWKGPWRWYDAKMLWFGLGYDARMLDCCVDLDEIAERGLTFDECANPKP